MFQATQLDIERQHNSNSGVTPNCHRAALRKSREQRAPAQNPTRPAPPMHAPSPLLPLRLGGGSESQGPWPGLVPASKKSFPPGTCSESEQVLRWALPLPRPPPPPCPQPRPPGLQLQGALLPGHQEGVRELGVTQLPHLLGYREGFRLAPRPLGMLGWRDGDCAQGAMRTPGTGLGAGSSLPGPSEPSEGCLWLLEVEQQLSWPNVRKG